MYPSLSNATQLILCSSSLTIGPSSAPALITNHVQCANPFRLPVAIGVDNDSRLQEPGIIHNLLRVSGVRLIIGLRTMMYCRTSLLANLLDLLKLLVGSLPVRPPLPSGCR
jgi:hypothetical protein